MLQINFEILTSTRPELKGVWSRFARWARANKQLQTIDPRRVARDIPDIPPYVLAEAFFELVKHGFLKQKYMVEDRKGRLLGDAFDEPDRAPDQVKGRKDEIVNTSSCQIVPVFQKEVEDGPSSSS